RIRLARFLSVGPREALAYSCAALGLDAAPHLDTLMAEYLALAPFPEVPKALSRLTLKKAILSNGSPDLLDPLVRNSGLRFDAVLSVDELKVYKPAPQVYELAGRRLGEAKERRRRVRL